MAEENELTWDTLHNFYQEGVAEMSKPPRTEIFILVHPRDVKTVRRILREFGLDDG